MTSARRWPIFDGHNDTLFELCFPKKGKERSFFERGLHGHLDLPRALEGGFSGGLFAVFARSPRESGPPLSKMKSTESGYEFLPFEPVTFEEALPLALQMMSLLFRLEAQSQGRFRVVRSAAELERCLHRGVLAAVLHAEGAEMVDPQLDALEVFYQAGLRSLGITWSRSNAFGHGVPLKFPASPDTGPGLTDAGKALVKACNTLGVLVDMAHLNEKGFWDVAQLSDAPLVVTHSGAHQLCPSTRNLTNEQLDAIAQTNGVVGVSFNVRDLRMDGRTEPDTPLIEIVRHVNYISKRIGIEHVAFGSDFDGTNISNELKDVTGLPKLIAALEEEGYDKSDLRKLTHHNWLRVLRRTWKD